MLVTLLGAALVLAGCSVQVDVNGQKTNVEVQTPDIDIRLPAGDPGVVPVDVALPGGATEVEVRVYQAVGEVRVEGSGTAALSGVVGYWKNPPSISDRVTGDRLVVEIQGERGVANVTGRAPDTVLQLGADLPTRLEVEAGVGSVQVDLTRVDARLVRIEAGVGEVKVRVPAEANVRVWYKAGVGASNLGAAGFSRDGDAWVSPGFRPDDVMEVHVESGVGAFDIARL
jgi:hypothetical protein